MTSCDAAIARAPAGACEEVAETEIARLRRLYGHLDAQSFLRAMIEREFRGRIAAVSSFGAESAVILALIAEIDPATPVIFLYRLALRRDDRLSRPAGRAAGPDEPSVGDTGGRRPAARGSRQSSPWQRSRPLLPYSQGAAA